MQPRSLPPFLLAVLTLSAAPVLAQDEKKAEAKPQKKAVKLETVNQKACYVIGHSIGTQLKRDAVELDMDAFLAGLREAMQGKRMRLDKSKLRETMEAAQKAWQERARKQQAEVGKKNLAEGKAFLAKNKTAEGVVTTASGLQYKVLKAGTGKKPTASSSVTVHYHGTLLDGTVFDSSVESKSPATFQVGGVIRGWTEALQLMPVGSKWKLFIPSDLAYGPNPRGGPIGPNAVLVFEVELLKIN